MRDSTTLAVLPLALVAVTLTAGHVEDGAAPGLIPAGVEERVASPSPVAMEGPASYSGPQIRAAAPTRISVDVSGVPLAAIVAYRRAEAVMGAADSACRLPWQLLAALGRVESDHGRYGGSRLGTDGVSRPGVYGVRLDGARGTQAIRDTDGGLYDKDRVWDRAVGPMQFIPSTWSAVGVDADADQRRDPQDIDDAALGAGVYLCAGEGDLADDADLRSAVFRYNHSEAYVDLVLDVMRAYLLQDPSIDRTPRLVRALFVAGHRDDSRNEQDGSDNQPPKADQHTPLGPDLPDPPPEPPDTCVPDPSAPLEPTEPAPTPTVEPTEPAPTPTVGPTEPAPTPTVEPTEPAPTPTVEPTEPAEPSPTEPTATVDPTEYVEPTGSVGPSEPTEPTQSTEPTQTVDPTETRPPQIICHPVYALLAE